jgi:hypothetical protein
LLVAEEEAELLKEFGAEPVFVILAERISLPVDITRRVSWNILERDF